MAVTNCVAFPITLKIMHFTFGVSYDCQIKPLRFHKRHLSICLCNYEGLSSVRQELSMYILDSMPPKLTAKFPSISSSSDFLKISYNSSF
jgi:hypothetical protein